MKSKRHKAKVAKTSRRSAPRNIRDAKTLDDKLALARYGMTAQQYEASEMTLARDFFITRHVQMKELEARVQRELSSNKDLTLRTEREFTTLKSAEKRLCRYAWTAAKSWKPEMFERLASAMRRFQGHKTPDERDGWRRACLVACKGNVDDAVACVFWNCDPDNERRTFNRLNKTLFPKDR